MLGLYNARGVPKQHNHTTQQADVTSLCAAGLLLQLTLFDVAHIISRYKPRKKGTMGLLVLVMPLWVYKITQNARTWPDQHRGVCFWCAFLLSLRLYCIIYTTAQSRDPKLSEYNPVVVAY